jgi:protein phosphatase
VLSLAIVIAAIVFGATYGLRHVWFLGTDDAGRVALYRGVPYELPFGIKLYSERHSAPVQTEALPERRQDAVTGHGLRSHADAVALLEEIERGQGVRE